MGRAIIFLSGRPADPGSGAFAGTYPFDDKVWGQVYEDSKKYFPEQEIVRWFAGFPGFNMEITEEIRKTHLDHLPAMTKCCF